MDTNKLRAELRGSVTQLAESIITLKRLAV